jgi:hypothetical protein
VKDNINLVAANIEALFVCGAEFVDFIEEDVCRGIVCGEG